jgi:hypothetical protein
VSELQTYALKALKDNSYARHKHLCLKTDDGYCPLGVLCDIAISYNGLKKEIDESNSSVKWRKSTGGEYDLVVNGDFVASHCPPDFVVDLFGLNVDVMSNVVKMHYLGGDFKSIAQYLEGVWNGKSS